MANNTIEWIFSLFDKVSGPAAKIQSTITQVDKAVKSAGEQAEKSEKSFESLFTTIDHGVNVFEKFARGAEFIGDIALSFADAGIEAASFQETTKIALDTVLGDHEAAMSVLKQGKDLAALTPSTTEEILSAGTGFILAGFDPKELQNLEVAMNDIKALNPGRANFSAERFGQILQEIPGVGLDERHIKELARDTHLPMSSIFEQLSKNFGMSQDEIQKNLKNLDAHGIIVSILDALRAKEGGELGNLTYKFSQTLPGLMSTLKSRPMELLMDLDTSPGFARIKDMITKVNAFLDPNSATGKRITGYAAGLFNDFFTNIFGGDTLDPDGIEKKLEGLLQTSLGIATALGGGIQGALDGLFDSSDDLFSGPMSPEKLKQIREESKRFGHEVADAFKGLLTVLEGIGKAFLALDKPFAALRDARAHFAGKDENIISGFLRNYRDAAPDIQFHARPPMTPASGSDASGDTKVGDVHVTVHAGHTNDPHETGKEVHKAVKAAILDSLERAATEHGGMSRAVP